MYETRDSDDGNYLLLHARTEISAPRPPWVEGKSDVAGLLGQNFQELDLKLPGMCAPPKLSMLGLALPDPALTSILSPPVLASISRPSPDLPAPCLRHRLTS